MTETPTSVWRTWFPAIVRLPDRTTLTRAKAYATDTGLFVYAQAIPPTSVGMPMAGLAHSSPALVFSSPILLDKTREPGTDYASQQAGHILVTEAGTVTVTKSGACSCGMRSLKSFAPAWAVAERKWGE